MSHGETVIVVVIISIGNVIVIQTVIIPILTSLRMWVSRDGLFSLGKASKVIQPPTIPCIAFACAAFKSHSASYVRSDPPYYTIASTRIASSCIQTYCFELQKKKMHQLHNCCRFHCTQYFVPKVQSFYHHCCLKIYIFAPCMYCSQQGLFSVCSFVC